MRFRRLALALLSAAGLAGCTSGAPPPKPMADGQVTIFLPGIKGSFLWTDGPERERAWLSAGDALSSGDRSLALPPGGDDRFGPLHADGVLTRFRFFPFVAEDVYLPWLEFGAEELPGFEALAYDWRQDARVAVAKLAAKIDAVVAAHPGAQVNLVGHSLGGLIAFTYLRYGGGDPSGGVTWAGARHVRRAVLAGAPFGGAASFLRDIAEGDAVGRNRALLSAAAMRTFPSAFQLLPPEGALLAPGLVVAPERGVLARLVPEVAAREPLFEARRAFRAALAADAPAGMDAIAPPRILVVRGTGRPTIAQIALEGFDVNEVLAPDWEGSPRVPGDGRVPAAGAMPPGVKYDTCETGADHVQLLNDAEVQSAIARFLR